MGMMNQPTALEHVLITTKVEKIINWSRATSVWPMTFGLACCAIEMMAAGAARFDFDRFGWDLPGLAQADRPHDRRRHRHVQDGAHHQTAVRPDAEPKWVIALGSCATAGGLRQLSHHPGGGQDRARGRLHPGVARLRRPLAVVGPHAAHRRNQPPDPSIRRCRASQHDNELAPRGSSRPPPSAAPWRRPHPGKAGSARWYSPSTHRSPPPAAASPPYRRPGSPHRPARNSPPSGRSSAPAAAASSILTGRTAAQRKPAPPARSSGSLEIGGPKVGVDTTDGLCRLLTLHHVGRVARLHPHRIGSGQILPLRVLRIHHVAISR